MAEEYGRYGPKYYAVAVVKKSNENLKLDKTLRGKKSCHTGARRTAGWNVPIGYLIGENVIPKEGCDTKYFDFISVGNFFSKSCVPGETEILITIIIIVIIIIIIIISRIVVIIIISVLGQMGGDSKHRPGRRIILGFWLYDPLLF